MKPGLYKNKKLVMSWENLLDCDIIHLEEGVLTTNYIPDTEDNEEIYDVSELDTNISGSELNGLLVLPNDGTIKELGETCFCATPNLTGVILPDSLEIINRAAFATSGITELNVPENVREIRSNTLFACNKLKSIKLPENISFVDFYGMSQRKKENVKLTIGKNVYNSVSEFEEEMHIINNLKEGKLDDLLDKYTFKRINELSGMDKLIKTNFEEDFYEDL